LLTNRIGHDLAALTCVAAPPGRVEDRIQAAKDRAQLTVA